MSAGSTVKLLPSQLELGSGTAMLTLIATTNTCGALAPWEDNRCDDVPTLSANGNVSASSGGSGSSSADPAFSLILGTFSASLEGGADDTSWAAWASNTNPCQSAYTINQGATDYPKCGTQFCDPNGRCGFTTDSLWIDLNGNFYEQGVFQTSGWPECFGGVYFVNVW
ncbi:hypothetical protein TrVGV298_002197 [Trichoderma virens]|nr:hypothetical protein TrVGV298_002197 [Trichoderma virens]